MHYRHNQTLLANDLNVNRSTLRKYMSDTEGNHHFIKKNGTALELYINNSNKVSK